MLGNTARTTAPISRGPRSVPRRQLEFRMRRLVPFLGTTVVLYDDRCRVAEHYLNDPPANRDATSGQV